MNRFFTQWNLKPGDEVVLPKSNFNIVQHHAVYIGADYSGSHWMVENKIGQGVVLTHVDLFFRTNPSLTRINKFHGSGYERKVLVQKALKSVGKPYNLINYNCEHFSNDLRNGMPRSRQVESIGLGLIAAVIVGAILSNKQL